MQPVVVQRNFEDQLRSSFYRHLNLVEVSFYIGIALLLSVAALLAIIEAGQKLWQGIVAHETTNYSLVALDRLLLVLMLVEILHTVRMSIQSREFILVRPFLIVGIIASIRRALVITIQAAPVVAEANATPEAARVFTYAMVELGLLGLVVLVLAAAARMLEGRGSVAEKVRKAGAESSNLRKIDSGA